MNNFINTVLLLWKHDTNNAAELSYVQLFKIKIILSVIFILVVNYGIALFFYVFYKKIIRVSRLNFNKTDLTGQQLTLRFLKEYSIEDLKIVPKKWKYYFSSPYSKKISFFQKYYYVNNVFSNTIALITASQIIVCKLQKWKYYLYYLPFKLRILWILWAFFYMSIMDFLLGGGGPCSQNLLWISTSILCVMLLYSMFVTIVCISKNNQMIFRFIDNHNFFDINQKKTLKKQIKIHNYILICGWLFASCFLIIFINYIIKSIYYKIIK